MTCYWRYSCLEVGMIIILVWNQAGRYDIHVCSLWGIRITVLLDRLETKVTKAGGEIRPWDELEAKLK